MRSISHLFLTVLTASTALRPGAAEAADAAGESRLREALRSATAQLQALEDERAGWRAKETQSQKEVESLRKQLAAARQAAGKGGGRQLGDLNQRLAEQAEAAAKATQSLAQCQNTARDAAETARAKEEERARLAVQAATLAERGAACEAKNARMYAVGKDVIDWLSNVGVVAALAAREPFLGLKRVELENAAQDYEDKLLEQKVKP